MGKKNTKMIAAIAIILIISISLLAVFVFNVGGLGSGDTPTFYQGMTITYEDGTTKDYLPTDAPLLNIIDSATGKTVTAITVNLFAKPEFTGEITTWTASGYATWQLKSASGSVLQSFDRPIYTSGQTLQSGQTKLLTSGTSTANDIESLYSGWENGKTYFFSVILNDFEMELHFADGTSQTRTATAQPINWQFKYESGYAFTSLQVTWGFDA